MRRSAARSIAASIASMTAGSVTGLAMLASWLGAPAPTDVDGSRSSQTGRDRCMSQACGQPRDLSTRFVLDLDADPDAKALRLIWAPKE